MRDTNTEKCKECIKNSKGRILPCEICRYDCQPFKNMKEVKKNDLY